MNSSYDYVIENLIKEDKDKFKLKQYMGIILRENESSMIPYHNTRHLFNVCLATDSLIYEYRTILTYEQKRALYIAALFHDMNHSGGKFSDTVNIKKAIATVVQYIQPKESDAFTDEVINLIKATEYPYVISKKDLTLSQKILRDADLYQAQFVNVLFDITIPLMEEMKCDSMIKFIEKNIEWWKGIEFNTVIMCKEYGPETRRYVIKSSKEILKLINNK